MSKIPDSWMSTTIASVTKSITSIDPTMTPKRIFKYVDIGSIDNKTQTIANQKTFPGINAPSRARRVIKQGDTLFSTVRTYLKNIAIVPSELDGELTSTGISVLRPSGAIDPRYLFRWTCTDEFVNALSSAQDGTMYPAVSDRDVADATIRLPPCWSSAGSWPRSTACPPSPVALAITSTISPASSRNTNRPCSRRRSTRWDRTQICNRYVNARRSSQADRAVGRNITPMKAHFLFASLTLEGGTLRLRMMMCSE